MRKTSKLAADRYLGRNLLLALGVVLADCALTSASAQIAFQDVSTAAGFANTYSETWGAAWGDLDGDGYPDLFSSNHRMRASLFHNNQNGTFADVSKLVDLSKSPGWTGGRADVDTHGSTWADIDNDGDEDLIETVSSNVDHLWINNGGKLTLSTTQWAVDKTRTRSKRQDLFFDYNGDGKLDLVQIGLSYPAYYPQLSNGTFGSGKNVDKPMACTSDGEWGHISDINSAQGLEVICAPRKGTYPKVNTFSTSFFGAQINDVSSQYAQYGPVNDVAVLDYDNDLKPDLFLVRGSERPSDAYQYSDTAFEMQIITAANKSKSVTFQTTGVLTISASLRSGLNSSDPQYEGDPQYIFVGQNGVHPSALVFNLDPADPNSAGLMIQTSGLSIGYDPNTSTWTINQGNKQYNYSYLQVSSTSSITGLTFIGASGSDLGYKPILLHNNGSGFDQMILRGGLSTNLRCQSVVSGDFDNDMHEDLFMACTGGAHNIPNRLFRNNGDGTFTEIADAGGASGVVGAAVNEHAGTSESVVTADYDLDGFLDLMVTNGDNMRPLNLGGPKQLFHNLGNGNHWLEFDLVGTTSNRDAIGSKVYVTSGGVTQYREQNGGYHRWSQNFMRVHVGLATNTQADVTVVWPDGSSTTYPGLQANYVYQLKQDGSSLQTHGTGVPAAQIH